MFKSAILAACAAAALIAGAASAQPVPPAPAPPPMDMSGLIVDPQPDVQTDPAVIRRNQALADAMLKAYREQQTGCVPYHPRGYDRKPDDCRYVRDQWGNASYIC